MFRASIENGLKIEQDIEMAAKLRKAANQRLNDNYESFIPDTKIIADHISTDIGCMRKAAFSKRDRQAEVDLLGHVPLDLDDRKVALFGNGYGWQYNIMGDTERNIWDDDLQLWWSIDGEFEQHALEAKQTGFAPMNKADESSGLSVEDILRRNNPGWWIHMILSMHLNGHRDHWLVVNWKFARGDQPMWTALKVTATDELVESTWQEHAKKRTERREYEATGATPPIHHRITTGAYPDCTYCPYASEDPCLTELR
jgi:hypothetical protein